jgi:AcrR family transcriptional regulator
MSSTASRSIDAALTSFAAKGYEATSLDALAGELGVTKQTILHHFGSKERLLGAVLQRTVGEVAAVIDESLARTPESGWAALEAVVRAVFGLAGRRPELAGFLREVGRLGPPHDALLVAELGPLTERATAFLSSEMADVSRHPTGSRRWDTSPRSASAFVPTSAGRPRLPGRWDTSPRSAEQLVPTSARRHADPDPRGVVLAAYAAVIGAVTELEVLRQLGERPSARLLVRRRRELLVYLSDLLGLTRAADQRS